MATGSRALWKGAITFGLVHIPVSLHTATTEQGVDFDWLDDRSMDPVGYKRVNKKTGREVPKEHIVKGIAYEEGQYVILTPAEIAAAYPRTTQTIEIDCFVEAPEIPFLYLERPYYLAPIQRGHKVYALLRETLRRSGRIGLARVVIQSKQHLAALVASGPALVLNLLRWGDEVKPLEGLDLPPEDAKAAKLGAAELRMAGQLVEDMRGRWDPAAYHDEFRDAIMALVQQKVKAGKTQTVVAPQEDAGPSAGAEVIDLTELLRRSLGKRAPAADSAKPARKRAAAKPRKAA